MYPYEGKNKEDRKEDKEEQIKEIVVRQYLSPKARERLNNLKLVNPELVKQVRELIYNLAISGRIKSPLSDAEVKELLYRIQNRRKREYRFRGLW